MKNNEKEHISEITNSNINSINEDSKHLIPDPNFNSKHFIDKFPNMLSFKGELEKKAKIFNKNKLQIFKGKNFKSDNSSDKNKVIMEICSYCKREFEKSIIKMHFDSHPSKILDWLFLGDYNNATNKKELQYINVKYVMNCALECKNLFNEEFTYKNFKLSV